MLTIKIKIKIKKLISCVDMFKMSCVIVRAPCGGQVRTSPQIPHQESNPPLSGLKRTDSIYYDTAYTHGTWITLNMLMFDFCQSSLEIQMLIFYFCHSNKKLSIHSLHYRRIAAYFYCPWYKTAARARNHKAHLLHRDHIYTRNNCTELKPFIVWTQNIHISQPTASPNV